MKLIFLGAMSSLVVNSGKFQSNMLIESKTGQNMLIDCGSDIRHSLHARGYHHSDIGAVYISHLHADHTGGLEWLGFSTYFMEHRRPALYISPDQCHALWNNVLSGGMKTLEEEEATLSTFFDVKPIEDHRFVWEQYDFQLVKTHHAISHHHVLPSYGLLISGDEKKIFISTDTTLNTDWPNTIYQQADVIFNDCETSLRRTKQHSHYDELNQLDWRIKQKMWLYDYNDMQWPDAKKDGFQGFVTQGDCFNF